MLGVPTHRMTARPATSAAGRKADRKKTAAIALAGAEWDPPAIAEALDVHPETVRRWIREIRQALDQLG